MTKRLFFTICLIAYGASLSAQVTPAKSAKDSVLYIVDGVKQIGAPRLKADEIVQLVVSIDKNAALIQYGPEARYGVVKIGTLKAQVAAYQNVFAPLCQPYKQYLEKNGNNDNTVKYILDAQPLAGTQKEKAAKLALLDRGNIKELTFKMAKDNSNVKTLIATLNITTNN